MVVSLLIRICTYVRDRVVLVERLYISGRVTTNDQSLYEGHGYYISARVMGVLVEGLRVY